MVITLIVSYIQNIHCLLNSFDYLLFYMKPDTINIIIFGFTDLSLYAHMIYINSYLLHTQTIYQGQVIV